MNVGRITARTIVGGYFAAHGVQQGFGWFAGDGLETTAARFESVGIRPGKPNVVLAAATQISGGLALGLGVGTPVAGAGLIATMVTAIRKVHLPNGPFIQNHGFEYPLVVIGVLLTLVEDGPGYPAVDRGGRGRRGALIALTVGLAGSFLADAIGQQIARRTRALNKNPDASSPTETPYPSEAGLRASPPTS